MGAFDPAKYGATPAQGQEFDPAQYGAIPAAQPAAPQGFDPLKYGAVPVETPGTVDVRMPDGTIIQNVPSSIGKAKLLQMYSKHLASQARGGAPAAGQNIDWSKYRVKGTPENIDWSKYEVRPPVAPAAATKPPDVHTLISDPNFQALPLPAKNKLLMQVDPNFRNLSPQERMKALNVIEYQTPAAGQRAQMATGPFAPLIPTAAQAYQQGLQSASQQGGIGRAIAAVGGQILPTYHAASEQVFSGSPGITEAATNVPQGLSYIAQHPLDAARMLAGSFVNSVTQPIENAGKDGSLPEVGVMEGIGNIFGVGTSARQAAEAAASGQYGKAIGTIVPTLVQLALGAKVPEDVLKGYTREYPVTTQMREGLTTAGGDVIRPTMATVAAHGGAPAFQRIASQLPGGQALREAGQVGITDAARAYTRAVIRVGEEAGAKDLDAALGRFPVRDIGRRTQVVGDAVRQNASTLYESLSAAYQQDPRVFQPVAGQLSKWAASTLQSGEFDRLIAGSPEFGSGLRKSLESLQNADYLKSGATVQGQPVDLMANYQNARSDLKDIQMNAKSSNDRRIAGQAVDQLDQVIADGFSKTGNSALNEIFQDANRKWRQGSALMELGSALEPAYRNIEPEMQIGTEYRPTVLSAKRVEDALTELSKEPIRPGPSRFATAVPNPIDQKTIHQIASFLVKNEAAGGTSIAGQFGVLRTEEAASEFAVNPTRPISVTAYALRLPGTAKLMAWAMSSPRAAALMLEFSRAIPGTTHAAALAARVNANLATWASGQGTQ